MSALNEKPEIFIEDLYALILKLLSYLSNEQLEEFHNWLKKENECLDALIKSGRYRNGKTRTTNTGSTN